MIIRFNCTKGQNCKKSVNKSCLPKKASGLFWSFDSSNPSVAPGGWAWLLMCLTQPAASRALQTLGQDRIKVNHPELILILLQTHICMSFFLTFYLLFHCYHSSALQATTLKHPNNIPANMRSEDYNYLCIQQTGDTYSHLSALLPRLLLEDDSRGRKSNK